MSGDRLDFAKDFIVAHRPSNSNWLANTRNDWATTNFFLSFYGIFYRLFPVPGGRAVLAAKSEEHPESLRKRHANCRTLGLTRKTSSDRKTLNFLRRLIMLHAPRFAALALVFGVGASAVLAQNPPVPDRAPAPQARAITGQAAKVTAATAFPSSKLKGLNVRNTKGETVGSVDDLVISVTDGKVHYVAMSVGGVLGIGDKLFAIPFGELKFNHGRDEMFFVLDISKEKLEQAPGFDKNQWPDFADPQWRAKVDKYYEKPTTERTTRTPAPVRSE
jgi:sporulation protein YlmC with PRC-barrel domain